MSGPGSDQTEPGRPPSLEGTVILPMTPADVEEVTALEKVCFPTAWTKESYLRELANPRGCYLVAREAGPGKLVGYAGLRVVGPEAHVSTLCVVPECRRQGLATALLNRLAHMQIQWSAIESLMQSRYNTDGLLSANPLFENAQNASRET